MKRYDKVKEYKDILSRYKTIDESDTLKKGIDYITVPVLNKNYLMDENLDSLIKEMDELFVKMVLWELANNTKADIQKALEEDNNRYFGYLLLLCDYDIEGFDIVAGFRAYSNIIMN